MLGLGAAPSAANAQSLVADVSLTPLNSADQLVNEPLAFVIILRVPEITSDVTVTVTVDFTSIISSVDLLEQPEACVRQSASSICTFEFGAGSATERWLYFGVAPKHGAAWVTDRVRAVAKVEGATDPNLGNNTLDLTFDVRTNLADVWAEVVGPAYQLVGDWLSGMDVNVWTPNPRKHVTLAALFDFSAVRHAVEIASSDPADCTSAGTAKYRCEFVYDARNNPSPSVGASFGFTLRAKSGAPAGPAGKVKVTVEQVGGVDPNLSNNAASITLDIVKGRALAWIDWGEASGRVGETVRVPVTITNRGPDTFQFVSITHTTQVGGLELVGYEGCAANPYANRRGCAVPPWFTAGSTYTVWILIKITRCPDGDTVDGGASASAARVDWDRPGSVFAVGCGGPTSGGSAGPGSTNPTAGAAVADLDATMPEAAPSASGADVEPAAQAGPAPIGGDLIPLGEQRPADTGLGLVGLVALVALLGAARGARWLLVRI